MGSGRGYGRRLVASFGGKGARYRYCVSFTLLWQVLTPVMCGESPTHPCHVLGATLCVSYFIFSLENCQFWLTMCKTFKIDEKKSQRAVTWYQAVSSDCLCIYPSTLSLIFANIVPFLSDDYQNCNAHLEFSHLNCFYLSLLLSPVVANFESWVFVSKRFFRFVSRSNESFFCYRRVDFKQWNDRDHSPIHFLVNGNW